MAHRLKAPCLTDMVEAIERVRHVMGDLDLDGFEADWDQRDRNAESPNRAEPNKINSYLCI